MDSKPGAEARAVEWAMLRRELNVEHEAGHITVEHLRWFVRTLTVGQRDLLMSENKQASPVFSFEDLRNLRGITLPDGCESLFSSKADEEFPNNEMGRSGCF